MEGTGATSLPLRRLPRAGDQRQCVRSLRHARAFHGRLRDHPAQICGLVEEAGAHPRAASAIRLARSAGETRPRLRHLPHRTRYAAGSRDPDDSASPAGSNPSHPHRHLRPARLRHLRLAVLRERTDHHGFAPYQLSAKASSRGPRRRLQRLPSRRPKRRSPGLHPRPLRNPSREDTLAQLSKTASRVSLSTKNLELRPYNYRSSRISLSLAADKSSIFLVSACEIFSISSSARFCSSWLIFLSFSSLSIVSLTSRRMLRTAVR